ncbi:MAG TPA: ROK family protein [Terriglobales bacterium]|nr:ROK family protein [Terriglobales bacterium]
MSVFGCIEAGGTKFVCGVGTGPDDLELATFPTASPAATLESVIAFFKHRARGRLSAVGIGSFGPVDLHPESPTFGYITSTPKAGWQQYDLAGTVGRALEVPVGFDTDVNAAAAGEARWGAGRGIPNFIYLTVGTGIGGGAIVNGEVIHGLLHPEMGHIRVPHDLATDPYPGGCPYHHDCLEGLAAGPAMQARWGILAQELPPDHPGWKLEAHYLALGLATWVCTLSPERMLLGGGVMQQEQLFPMVRQDLAQLLNGYIRASAVLGEIDQYVVPPQLGNRAGVLGAMVLAEHIYRNPSASIAAPLAGEDTWRSTPRS